MIKQFAQQMLYIHVDSVRVESDMRCCTAIGHDYIFFWNKGHNHSNKLSK
jgi:hypothetical protein